MTHMDLRPENLCFRGDELVAVLDLSSRAASCACSRYAWIQIYAGLTRIHPIRCVDLIYQT